MLSIVHWITVYLLPLLLGYLILAAAIIVIDRKIGTRIYAWYYNRGKVEGEDLLPGVMGFIYRQPLRRQHNRALGLSVFFSALTVFFGSFTVLELIGEFFAIFFEAWVMLPGFWLGNVLYEKILLRQDEIFEAIDNRGDMTANFSLRLKRILASVVALWPGHKTGSVSSSAQSGEGSASTTSSRPLSAAEIVRRAREGRSI